MRRIQAAMLLTLPRCRRRSPDTAAPVARHRPPDLPPIGDRLPCTRSWSPPPAFPPLSTTSPPASPSSTAQTMRDARLQHAGRCAAGGAGPARRRNPAGRAATPACSSAAPTPTTCWCCCDGMPINDAADPHGAFNFGVDTLADVERIEVIRGPMAALYGSGAIGGVINLITRTGTQPGVHCHGDLAGGYPAQVRGTRRRCPASRAGLRLRADRASAVAARLRHHAAARVDLHRHAAAATATRSARSTSATPRSTARGSRCCCARARRCSASTISASRPSTTPTPPARDASLDRAHRRAQRAVRRHLRDRRCSSAGVQDDRRYTEPLNPARPQPGDARTTRYHSYRTDLQWNNTVHLTTCCTSPRCRATDLTFGYEHTADSAKVRVNDAADGFPYAAERQGVDDRRCGLCRAADHAVAAPDADRADPPGLRC